LKNQSETDLKIVRCERKINGLAAHIGRPRKNTKFKNRQSPKK